LRTRIHRLGLVATLLLPTVGAVFAQEPSDKAWTVLQAGLADKTAAGRAVAVRVLGLLENDPTASDLALKALADEKPEVRAAAAMLWAR
jgi:HEAT repeat protein